MSDPRRGRKLLVVDIDGTICEDTKGKNYVDPAPLTEVIRRVNDFWTMGWHVTIFTARGMRTYEGDLELIEANFRKITEDWLKANRVCYDELRFGKPPADLYVEDKGVVPATFAGMEF